MAEKKTKISPNVDETMKELETHGSFELPDVYKRQVLYDHLPLQILGLVNTGKTLKLLDKLTGFACGKKSGGLDCINKQFQLCNLKLTAGKIKPRRDVYKRQVQRSPALQKEHRTHLPAVLLPAPTSSLPLIQRNQNNPISRCV